MLFPALIRHRLPLTAAVLLLSLFAAAADTTSETHPGLKQLLQRYPDADLNKDGILTLEEAKGFRTHLWQAETEAGTPVERTTPEVAAVEPAQSSDPLLSGVAYGEAPGQRFDLWLPRSSVPPYPAVFCLALEAEKAPPPADLLKKCLDSGIAVGVLHARDGGDRAAYFEDVTLGLRFLCDNGHAHGVRADRMALFGQDAVAEHVLYGALLLPCGEGNAAGVRCAAIVDASFGGGMDVPHEPGASLETTCPAVNRLLAEDHGTPAIALFYTGPDEEDLLIRALREKKVNITVNHAGANEGLPHLLRQAVLFFAAQTGGDDTNEAPVLPTKKELP